MRTISFKTQSGDVNLEVAQKLVDHIASKNGIVSSAVSDSMILGFFREASDSALRKAAAEYLNPDGEDS